ncbi:hypothetical protein [Oceaniradius stylonematis]|uniref:hypothetical protein n=1 Tax=Oceaniradius stylonematis TaxID=2184161 RepID=UPI0035D10F00
MNTKIVKKPVKDHKGQSAGATPPQPEAANRTTKEGMAVDPVAETLKQTFPASDPPSWWAGQKTD